jgi:hypothetical protein
MDPSKMIKLIILSLAFATSAAANESDDFAKNVFQVTLGNDFGAYAKLLHPECKPKEYSEKAFQMRSKLLTKLSPGFKTEALSMGNYNELKANNGNPFVNSYAVQPSHYAVVWPPGSAKSKGARIDLNPLIKTDSGWKLLDGSCIISEKK